MIHLDQLIATLMQVVIENAGAETGALVLLEEDQLTVVAQCSGNKPCDLEKLAVADCATIPVSVILSVERTQETLVFDDAVSEPFSTDPYIQHQQPRSLLCMPILQQSQLIGILYLENNLSPGVFTSDRLQVLKLLMAQAAISLENARLYEQLADYTETLESKVEQRTQSLQQEIAERQQTEAALRQSEANYRNLLQTANSVIIRYNQQGRIRYINDFGVKLLGYEEHEIIGRTLFETIIPEAELSGRDVRPMVHDLLHNPQSYPQGEGENLCRDGRRVWMTWSNQAIFNDQGEIVEILSVGNDTTQRRQAEEALQRSEANYRNLIQTANSIILRMDRQGRIRYINDFGLSFFGYEKDQILGHTLLETIVPETETSGHNLKQFVHDLLHDLEAPLPQAYLQIENENLCRDGKRVWIAWSNQIIFNEQGEVVEILSVGNDITQRRQAEAALQASETKLRNLIEAIPDPLFVFSAEGRFLEIMVLDPNLLWHPFEEMIGKTMHQLGREEADEFLGYIQQVLRTQQILTVEYGAFLSGREMWFSARIAPISHDQVIWLVRDITAQKQAEATSILEERNRMAREIHDTLAQSFTGILAQVGAANQVLMDDVEATQAHLDLIKELARTGLSEARRSVVALRPQLLEEGSLQSALHRLIAQIRAAAMDTTLHYEIEGAVYALPTEVENNLLRMGQEALTNAIRHANADEIRVGLVYDRDQVCLRVKDNGQGFGVGSMPSSKGFGLLGMSERAERIGAQLTIRSQPGQGTEIIVVVGV